MSLHPMVFATMPDGSIATIQDPGTKVDRLEAAEPIVHRYLTKARRLGAIQMTIDVWNDLTCVSEFRARIRS